MDTESTYPRTIHGCGDWESLTVLPVVCAWQQQVRKRNQSADGPFSLPLCFLYKNLSNSAIINNTQVAHPSKQEG